MNEKLHTNGYIIIKDPLGSNQKNRALSSIVQVGGGKTKIDYNKFNEFINNDFIPKINETLGWSAIYLKYRFSNFQNAKDAAQFHGDIYNFADDDLMPIYTGLIYFDNSILEVIPGSHIKNNLSSNELYARRKQIKIIGGDMLVFHANMHHRGIFYETVNDRRLLQVFDIFPNNDIYTLYYPKLLSVITGQSFIVNNVSFISEATSKSKNLDTIISYLHYLMMNNGIQYKIIMSDICDEKKRGRYVGYVPGLVGTVKPGELQDWNINMTVIEHDIIMPNTTIQKITFMLVLLLLIGRCNFNSFKNIHKNIHKI